MSIEDGSQTGVDTRNIKLGVVEYVVFELPGRLVTLSLEQVAGYQMSSINPVWVACGSEGGLMPSLDPATALSRFVKQKRAERMVAAWSAYKDVPNQ